MEINVTAHYDQDSKRFHRFIIDADQEVVGNIYIPKTKSVPEMVIIRLQTKGDRSEHGTVNRTE